MLAGTDDPTVAVGVANDDVENDDEEFAGAVDRKFVAAAAAAVVVAAAVGAGRSLSRCWCSCPTLVSWSFR